MKYILGAVLALILCPAALHAQVEDSPASSGDNGTQILCVRNDSGATTMTSANGDWGQCTVDSTGALRTSASGSTTAGHRAEDSAHTSTDTGQFVLSVRNTSLDTLAGTTLDYAPFASGTFGQNFCTPVYDSNVSTTTMALHLEDSALSNGMAGHKIFFQRQDTPTADATDGDAQYPKSNDVGAQYSEPANKVAVFTSGTLGFAAISGTMANVIVNTNKLKWCAFTNSTDVPVSWDDGTNEILSGQPANTVAFFDFGSNGRWVATNIRVKDTSAATASGSVYANCGY